jgi:2-phosphosulfolactate phosphatase
MESLQVHFLSRLVEPAALRGSTCVIIDVLRATTTIAFALEAGAKEVIPCLEVDDARRCAASLNAGTFMLGGERGGKKIDGFDLGNSPDEYTPQLVGGKTLVFTTTNGTRAMLHAGEADTILLAALVNVEAVTRALLRHAKVDILCAGTDGEISRDDVLTAGAIVDQLLGAVEGLKVNDEAEIAADEWRAATAYGLVECLRVSRGGRNLVELGLDNDIRAAAELSRLDVVPIFKNSRITRLVAAS